MDYAEFLEHKAILAPPTGFEPRAPWPEAIKQFQRDITVWQCRRGRSALFSATGLGKTVNELSWARQVIHHAQGQVIIFAPLAVAEQIVQVEAPKFGFNNVAYAQRHSTISSPVVVTNYDRRDCFDLSQFAGIGLDESGIIKDHDSRTRIELTEAARGVPYLLCASATPAPNDWTELGQHSEFLGIMSAKEMLATFFVHDGSVRAGAEEDWRLKRHAESDFWQWVASWAVMIRHPRDIGYDEPGYDLPPLTIEQITVPAEYAPTNEMLFPMEASTLQERIGARKSSVSGRVERAAAIVASAPEESWLVWCNLNSEADALVRAISGAVNVRGSDSIEHKTKTLLGFARGTPRVLVTKPTIAGRGMNWQHCNRMVFVGLNDSFESLFQALRRCWRFGQMRPVRAYLLASELEGAVVANLQNKERKYERMADAMVAQMKDLSAAAIHSARRPRTPYDPQIYMEAPPWLAA